MNKKSYVGFIAESAAFFLITLSVIHVFVEEYVTFMDYNILIKKYVYAAGLFFDFMFTIEFLARLSIAGNRGGIFDYLTHEGGVIDFLSSIPILLFFSGPLVWKLFFGEDGGIFIILGSFTFFKAVRIAQIVKPLRFMRILKIFGKMKNNNVMTPHFIKKGAILIVSIVVASLVGFSFVEGGSLFQSRSRVTRTLLKNYVENTESHNFNDFLRGSETVLFIKKDNEIVYRNISSLFFKNNFYYDDYFRTSVKDYEIYLNVKDVNKATSIIYMLSFAIIAGTLTAISTLYRRYFNKHLVSVIKVMLKGFTSANYLTPVRLNRNKGDFEIYKVAHQYNKKWLPLKRKIIDIKKRH
jgi:hypothetical protein